MYALVTIDFAGGVAMNNLVQIQVGEALIALEASRGVSTTVVAFPNLSVSGEEVGVATVSGGVFEGTLALVLSCDGQTDPVVTLKNLVPGPGGNPTTITWPCATMPQTQVLMPDNPLTLSGIVAN